MSYYDDIFDFAIDNHCLVTTGDAANLGNMRKFYLAGVSVCLAPSLPGTP